MIKSLNEYQVKSRETWIPNLDHELSQASLGLCGEAGEAADLIKKQFRGDSKKDQVKEPLKKELGDVLFYLCRLADYYGITLEEIANANIDKLQDRMKRGVLKGSGDER